MVNKYFFEGPAIGFNSFSMVFGSFNHWLQWFSMVMDHWSNDAMVSMYRSPLAGPKGLRAESARAVTGRRCPHSGKGEDFLTGQLNFYGNCCNSGTESRKIVPKVGN